MLVKDSYELKLLISKGKTKKAINLLLRCLDSIEDEDIRQEIRLLSSSWVAYEKSKRTGISTVEDQEITRNRINKALLQLIDEIEENLFNRRKKRFNFITIFVVLGLVFLFLMFVENPLKQILVENSINNTKNDQKREIKEDTSVEENEIRPEKEKQNYEIGLNKDVRVKPKDIPKREIVEEVFLKRYSLSGRVTDYRTGNGIPLVKIFSSNGEVKSITDNNGFFSIIIDTFSMYSLKLYFEKESFSHYNKHFKFPEIKKEYKKTDIVIELKNE